MIALRAFAYYFVPLRGFSRKANWFYPSDEIILIKHNH